MVENEDEMSINPRIFHAIVGISTESTELLEALDFSGKELDNVNICEEFGDLDWYKAIGCDEFNISWDTILNTVIAKLKARYPENFTSKEFSIWIKASLKLIFMSTVCCAKAFRDNSKKAMLIK